ncbi:hypothetical protein HN937_08795 [Candidatus Poribacteria bacterium]|jgi:hypothetical protein|nr:hypothetical protein [Candidatus Poribacteria bacterium]
MSEPVAIATIALEHCDIVLLSDDSDGFGFYVSSPHVQMVYRGGEWFRGGVYLIVGNEWIDMVDDDDLDTLREQAPAAFRDDADHITHGSLAAVLIRGEAPARWEG